MDMREFKAQYPAYKDIPDSELAHALYTRNYADKMSREEFLSMIVPSKPDVPEMGTGTKALRLAEMGSRGFVDSVAETIGAVPDLIGSKFVGPISESMGGPKYEPNALANAIKGTVRDAGKVMSIPLYAAIDAGPTEPTGAAERFAYGAGRGAGDAASFIVPGAATARLARPGSTLARVGEAVAANPAMQIASTAVGGGVTEASDSQLAGLAASALTPLSVATARRIATPVATRLRPEELRLARLARQYGIDLTPGQETGSPMLQLAEDVLAKMPFSAGPQSRLYEGQRAAFNRAVLRRAGIDSADASPGVLETGFRAIGQQFDDVIRRTPQVNIGPQFEQDIQRAAHEYGRRLDANLRPVFNSYMDDIAAMTTAARQPGVTNVFVDGQTYQNIGSGLRAAARDAEKDPALRRAITGLSDAFDNAMTRSVAPDVARAWRGARRNYRNLLAVNNAMTGGTATSRTAGDIPFGAFEQAVKSLDKRGYARGRGEMNDLARVGAFLSNKIPDSRTAQRTMMQNILSGGPLSALATGGAYAYSPSIALAMAAGLALPRAVQYGINSRLGRQYLTNRTAAPRLSLSDYGGLLTKTSAQTLTGDIVDTGERGYADGGIVKLKHGGPVNPKKPTPKSSLTRAQLMEAIRALSASGVLPKRKFADGGFTQTYNGVTDPNAYLNYGANPFSQFTSVAAETPPVPVRTGAATGSATSGALPPLLPGGEMDVGDIGDPAQAPAPGAPAATDAPSLSAIGDRAVDYVSNLSDGRIGSLVGMLAPFPGASFVGGALGTISDVIAANQSIDNRNSIANEAPAVSHLSFMDSLSALGNSVSGGLFGTSAKDQAQLAMMAGISPGHKPSGSGFGPGLSLGFNPGLAAEQDQAEENAAAEAAAAVDAANEDADAMYGDSLGGSDGPGESYAGETDDGHGAYDGWKTGGRVRRPSYVSAH